MALIGKLIGYVEISSDGKVLHDLIRYTPNDISSISPNKVHACNLQSGRGGDVGSTIVWHYTHDGKKKTTTEIIEEIDETNHKIVFKVIGGELVEEIYKAFKITFHCEQKDGKEWGIWSFGPWSSRSQIQVYLIQLLLWTIYVVFSKTWMIMQASSK